MPTDEDREALDSVMGLCRGLASAGSNTTNPKLFEPTMVSAVVALQKKLDRLECRLMDAMWRQVCKQKPLGNEEQAIKSETATMER